MRVVHQVTEAKKLYLADVKVGCMFSAYSNVKGRVCYYLRVFTPARNVFGQLTTAIDIEDGRVCAMPFDKEVINIFPNAFVTLGKDSSNADHS